MIAVNANAYSLLFEGSGPALGLMTRAQGLQGPLAPGALVAAAQQGVTQARANLEAAIPEAMTPPKVSPRLEAKANPEANPVNLGAVILENVTTPLGLNPGTQDLEASLAKAAQDLEAANLVAVAQDLEAANLVAVAQDLEAANLVAVALEARNLRLVPAGDVAMTQLAGGRRGLG